MAAMQKNPEQKAWADAVRIIFPNAGDRGSHVNVSGMAMAKNAPNKDSALKLMDFLASAEGQTIYAEVINEYPVSPAVAPSDLVKSWGTLKPDQLPLDKRITDLRGFARLSSDERGVDLLMADFDAGQFQFVVTDNLGLAAPTTPSAGSEHKSRHLDRKTGPGMLRGKHFTEYPDEVRTLRRYGKDDAAEELLLEPVDATEAVSPSFAVRASLLRAGLRFDESIEK